MAKIYCFTSTGNSLSTARKLANEIGAEVLPMSQYSQKRAACADEVIGFVFPVYFWGLPRMVDIFIKEMEITNKSAYVFAVATCGGAVFGVLGRLKELLEAKGIRLQYGTYLVSVSNYLPEYTAKDSESLRNKIDAGISIIADAVKNRESNRMLAFTFLNRLLYRAYPNKQSDQYFTVGGACTACGICQRVCPAKNITIMNGKPEFLHKCEHCLACLHNCPAHAIDWKKKTQGKERYRNVDVSVDEVIAFYE